MAKKIYCVKIGKKTGKFYTWDDCKAQVVGFKGAIYKSFLTEAEADTYLSGGEVKMQIDDSEKAISYVDGSYKKSTGEFSCGAVIFYKGKEEHISKKYDDANLAEMNNVAGELMGSVEVIRYCLKHEIKAVVIHHDYEGIARWAQGEWKANKKGTIAYKNYMDKIKKDIHVEFVKVKGHSGDKYNDLADKLAKEALGI